MQRVRAKGMEDFSAVVAGVQGTAVQVRVAPGASLVELRIEGGMIRPVALLTGFDAFQLAEVIERAQHVATSNKQANIKV